MTITDQLLFEKLTAADEFVRKRLTDPRARWLSMLVDGAYPNIERMWVLTEDGFRAVVHRILPVPEGQTPLIHWHTRPMAFLLLDGSYREGRGTGTPDGSPPVTLEERIRSPGDRHAMASPHEWHWVRPVRHSVLTVCVFGLPFRGMQERQTPMIHSPLPPDRLARLIADTRTIYGLSE